MNEQAQDYRMQGVAMMGNENYIKTKYANLKLYFTKQKSFILTKE